MLDRRVRWALRTFGVALALAAGSAVAQTSVPARIGWVYAMANAPVLIADQQGLFAEQGVEVELESFTSGPLIRKGFHEETLDPRLHRCASDRALGGEGREAVDSREGQLRPGLPRHAQEVGPRQGVRSPGNAARRRAGEVGDGRAAARVRAGRARRTGPRRTLPRSRRVRWRRWGAALEAGQYDAAFMWEPFVAKLLVRRTARVILNVNREVPYYPWYVIAVRDAYLERHPEQVRKVLRAHRAAIDYLNSSPNGGNDVIAQAFQLETETGEGGKTYSPEEIVKRARIASRVGMGPERRGSGVHRAPRRMEHGPGVHRAAVDIDDLLKLRTIRKLRRERR